MSSELKRRIGSIPGEVQWAGPLRASAPAGRPAFSLAEIMIAIGILGIGMLMVAATFPVGLDQSRIVSEQSRAPIIANEAFARLELLWNEPDSFKRLDSTVPFAVPPTAPLSFRQSLDIARAGAAVVRSTLPVTLAGANTGLDLNEWLATLPHLSIPPTGSAQWVYQPGRYYPSVPAWTGAGRIQVVSRVSASGSEYIDPPYTWSALYRMIPSGVQFIVFVNRQSPATPIRIQGATGGSSIRLFPPAGGLPDHVQVFGSTTSTWQPQSISILNPGGFMVSEANGEIYRIKSIELDLSLPASSRFPRIELGVPQGAPTPPNGVFWLVPADPNIGKSPCIGVYSRSYSF